MERATGFEPATTSLEGWDSTTELRPPLYTARPPERRSRGPHDHGAAGPPLRYGMVGRQGFEPWKPMATDLQSAPFVHLGTCPCASVTVCERAYLQRGVSNPVYLPHGRHNREQTPPPQLSFRSERDELLRN